MPSKQSGGRLVSRRETHHAVIAPPPPIIIPSSAPSNGSGSSPPTSAVGFDDITPSTHPSLRSSALASGWRSICLAGLVFCATIIAVWRLHGEAGGDNDLPPTVEAVWWAAWLTAVSSCLGVLPFLLKSMRSGVPSEATLGASNAVAGGMMIAAAFSLMQEGLGEGQNRGAAAAGVGAGTGAGEGAFYDVAIGMFVGVAVVAAAKSFVERWGGAEAVFDGLNAADARRAALLCFIMFLHSATEGVGIGVSFGARDPYHSGVTTNGRGHWSLGRFVSLSLSVHNIPEGLATSVALVPRGTPPIDAALWALATSLSQPLLAVVAYSAVSTFSRLLPLGLGFSAGAMGWVAGTELIPEAAEGLKDSGGKVAVVAISIVSAACMASLQSALR